MARKPAYVDTQNFGLDDLFYVDQLTMTKPFPVHRHSFAELHYIQGGRGAEIIDGVRYPLEAGSMSLKMPWHVHELEPEPGCPLEICKCSFRMSALEENGLLQSVSAALARSYGCRPVIQLPPPQREPVEAIFAAMMEEQRHIRPLKEEQMAALISQLVIAFLRFLQPPAEGGAVPTANALLRLMNLRYREPDLTCKAVAQAVHYSESQAARLLESQFGLPFGALLREIRIRNACGLLKTTDHPVESIALWAGYASRDGFYKAFVAQTGLTPAEYRSRHRATAEGASVLSSAQLYAKLIYYLHRHYAEPVTLAMAAARFHYSESHLTRVLKEQGSSFSKLLEEIRVYHARQLLLQGDLTAQAIAQATGFSSPETFYRAFKRQTGLTPAAYRRAAGPDAEPADKTEAF